jgi:BASS family bile acid:Na+ symporter
MQTFVSVAIPLITFLLLAAVGLDLSRADFARVRRQPRLVTAGLVGPLLLLPPIALGLIALFGPSPAVQAGLLLIVVCPIGGISNAYSYLARASTALSVTLTGLSCFLSVLTIPLLTALFERALGHPLGFFVPARILMVQLVAMLALPVGMGMVVRENWPSFAEAHAGSVRRLAVALLAALIVIVIASEADAFLREVKGTVPLAATFVIVSFAVGWGMGRALGADARDRFTLAVEFATRNVAMATAMAVTLLGQVAFAIFATTYFLTELPLMLAAIGWFRRSARAST